MNNKKTGRSHRSLRQWQRENYPNSADSAELRRSILGELAERYLEPEQEELKEILLPLLQLLNREYREGWGDMFEFTNGRPWETRSESMGVLIELPAWPAEFPLMARALVAILKTTASWSASPEGESMSELEFSLTTRSTGTSRNAFMREVFLLVQPRSGQVEPEPAKKQVKRLVTFLSDQNHLVALMPSDLRIF